MRPQAELVGLVSPAQFEDPELAPPRPSERPPALTISVTGRTLSTRPSVRRPTTGTAACPDIHVLVVGGGDQRAELTALAHRLGISRRVTFTGLLRNVTPALIAMDVLVQASDTEGTPRSVLEAMAHQRPVVATDVAELLDHGRCGELVPPGDASLLANAVKRVLADPSRTQNLTRCARSRYERHYTIEIMPSRVNDAYHCAYLPNMRGS